MLAPTCTLSDLWRENLPFGFYWLHTWKCNASTSDRLCISEGLVKDLVWSTKIGCFTCICWKGNAILFFWWSGKRTDLNSCQKYLYITAIQNRKISVIIETLAGFVLDWFAHSRSLRMEFCWFRATACTLWDFSSARSSVCFESIKIAADLQIGNCEYKNFTVTTMCNTINLDFPPLFELALWNLHSVAS